MVRAGRSLLPSRAVVERAARRAAPRPLMGPRGTTDLRDPHIVLSIVTVIHQSAPHLERLLASLDAHLPEAPQLIVVDTAPDDGGAALATRHGATVIELRDNPGFGAASNAGIERATGDYTALLNPDVVLVDDGLTRLASGDGLNVPRLLNPDGSAQDSVHPLPGSARNLARAASPGPLRRRIGERHPAW